MVTMTLKNLPYVLLTVLLLNGCAYKVVSTKEFEAMDARLAHLEKDVSVSKTKEVENKLVVGSVEQVHIHPANFVMDARIDTGAETSSINARDIVEFERDGQKWVRFTLVDANTGEPYVIERNVVREAKIVQSSLKKGYTNRVVVALKMTIGDKKELSEFTLTNREHMKYPILIGRNVLQDLILVDVSEKYIAPLSIKQKNSSKEL